MTTGHASRGTLLKDGNFRWLMGGAMLSGLGDQFTMIALPWLVLKMTGDPLALGLVIAIMGVPRAVFMLVGGALVDRYTPKSVLMLTKFANATLVGTLALLVLAAPALLTLPLLYALALAMGLAQAFSIPSGTSILPQVVAPERLQAANSMMMGLRQLLMLAGPLLGALLLALGGDDIQAAAGIDGAAGAADVADTTGMARAPGAASAAGAGGATDQAAAGGAMGIGLAFAFDCATFLVSAWTLAQVRPHAGATPATSLTASPAASPARQGVLQSVAEGIRMLWNDVAMRTCFLYWALVAVTVGGTMQVALPLLASRNLDGAASLGLLLGAQGIGTLAGTALSGMVRRGTPFGATILAIDALIGLLIAPLGLIAATWQGAVLLLATGVLGGYMQVAVFTWIQRGVPQHMLGRAMSLFMCIFMGVAPLSATAIGALLQWLTLAQLFAGAGLLLLAIAALAWLLTPMRHIDAAAAPATVSQP